MTAFKGAGVYPDMSDGAYFAHPALSHSDTKILLDCPAKFRHHQDHPADRDDPTPDMQFGTAVHSLVLGGPEVVRFDVEAWTKKDDKAARDAVIASGGVPLKAADYDRAADCAAAVRTHPIASKLLSAADHTEVVCIWDDDGIQRRAKIDIVSGRFIVDLKTTYNAGADDFGRSAAKYGYVTQAAYYMDAARACLGISDPKFLIVAVEKQPPHLVNVLEFDDYDLELGVRTVGRALDLYRRCVAADEWPGYPAGINRCPLPRWAEMEMEEA